MKPDHNQTGMTLVEILIAMLIGVFLLSGVIQIFISTKQSYRVQDGLSRIQENGRFAMDFLAKDLRTSGFLGCNSKVALVNTLNSPTNLLNNFATAVQGFEATTAVGGANATWSPTLDASITLPVGGSDIIAVRRADDNFFTVTAQGTDTLTLDSTATADNLKTAGILDNDSQNNCATLIVNDCASASAFQVTGVTNTVLTHQAAGTCSPKNSTPDLGKSYVGAQVYPVNTVIYYIRNNSAGIASLYRKIGAGQAQELVEGVEQMQILYGEDSDATPDGFANYYVKASDVTNMAKVVSVRITLTLFTVEQGISSLDNGRIKRNFVTTIALRNLVI